MSHNALYNLQLDSSRIRQTMYNVRGTVRTTAQTLGEVESFDHTANAVSQRNRTDDFRNQTAGNRAELSADRSADQLAAYQNGSSGQSPSNTNSNYPYSDAGRRYRENDVTGARVYADAQPVYNSGSVPNSGYSAPSYINGTTYAAGAAPTGTYNPASAPVTIDRRGHYTMPAFDPLQQPLNHMMHARSDAERAAAANEIAGVAAQMGDAFRQPANLGPAGHYTFPSSGVRITLHQGMTPYDLVQETLLAHGDRRGLDMVNQQLGASTANPPAPTQPNPSPTTTTQPGTTEPTIITPTQAQLDKVGETFAALQGAGANDPAKKKAALDAMKAITSSDGKVHLEELDGATINSGSKKVEFAPETYESAAFFTKVATDLGVRVPAASRGAGTGTGTGTSTGTATGTGTGTSTTTTSTDAPHLAGSTSHAKAHPMHLKTQAAPPALDIAPEQIKPLQELMNKKPDLKAILATDKFPEGNDGHYGPKTYAAIKLIAQEAGITDLKTIKFGDEKDPVRIKFMEALGKHGGNAAGVGNQQQPEQHQATAAELEAQRRAAEEARRAAAEQQRRADAERQVAADESRRPHILVDLPNDLKHKATISNLVGHAQLHDNGERIEFQGPQGANNGIMKDYVDAVRTTMDARGMRTSGESARETAGMILAAFNGVSTTDAIPDMARLRMPSQDDINKAVSTMGATVLNDGRIQNREFKLPADVLQNVVFGGTPPAPVPLAGTADPSMQAALAQAANHGVAPIPGVNPQGTANDAQAGNARASGQQPANGGRGQA